MRSWSSSCCIEKLLRVLNPSNPALFCLPKECVFVPKVQVIAAVMLFFYLSLFSFP
jgi:hypothetical protein